MRVLAVALIALFAACSSAADTQIIEGGIAGWQASFEAPADWSKGPFERWQPTAGVFDGERWVMTLVVRVSSLPADSSEDMSNFVRDQIERSPWWSVISERPAAAAGLSGTRWTLQYTNSDAAEERAVLFDPSGRGWRWNVSMRVFSRDDLDLYRPDFDRVLETLRIEWDSAWLTSADPP